MKPIINETMSAPQSTKSHNETLAFIESNLKNMEVAVKLPLKFYHDYNELAEQYNAQVAQQRNLPALPTYEEIQNRINQPGEGTALLLRDKGYSVQDFEESFVLHPLLQRFSEAFRRKLARKALDSYAPLANKLILEGLPAELTKSNQEIINLFERMLDIHEDDKENTIKMKKQIPVTIIHKLMPDFFPVLTLLTWSVATKFAYQTSLIEEKASKRANSQKQFHEEDAIPLVSEAGPLADDHTELDEFFGYVKGFDGRSLELSYQDTKLSHLLPQGELNFLTLAVKKHEAKTGLEGLAAHAQPLSIVKRALKPVKAMFTPMLDAGSSLVKQARNVLSVATASAARVLSKVYLMEKKTWVKQGRNAFTRALRRIAHGAVRSAAKLFFNKRSMQIKFNRDHVAVEIQSKNGKGRIRIHEKEFAQDINVLAVNMKNLTQAKSFTEALDVLRDIEKQIHTSKLVKQDIKESLHFSLEFLETMSHVENPQEVLEKFFSTAKLNDDVQVFLRDLSRATTSANKDPHHIKDLLSMLNQLLDPVKSAELGQIDNIDTLLAEWRKFLTKSHAQELMSKAQVAAHKVEQIVSEANKSLEELDIDKIPHIAGQQGVMWKDARKRKLLTDNIHTHQRTH